MKLSLVVHSAVIVVSALGLTACAAATDGAAAEDDASEASENALGAAAMQYCGGIHSTSPRYQFPAANSAMHAAGVTDALITQSVGDAPASAGTHCPEPGSSYSAATDIVAGASPCARVHALRAEGFAAWYRDASVGFGGNEHIHAVWAAAHPIKSSLVNQIASFERGHTGLVGDAVDTVCPITAAEEQIIASARAGNAPTPTPTPGCVVGARYCGGDKVTGDVGTLYTCTGGTTGTVAAVCANACVVNPGADDTCE